MIHRFSWNNGYINISYNESIQHKDYKKFDSCEVFDFCKSLPVTNKELKQPVSISLEIENHIGPRILYGMLFMTLEPVNGDSCGKLSVACTKENTILYGGGKTINARYESRYEGLPYEYIEGIITGVENYIKDNDNFPNCEINIPYARNCEVGSSIKLYENITVVMLRLVLSNEIKEIKELSAKEFLNKYFCTQS